MPELPEVETIARQLGPDLVGRRIMAVDAPWPSSLACGLDELSVLAQDRVITGARRRAKLVLLELDSRAILAVHLKMTGRLMVHDQGVEQDPYLRVRLVLDNGRTLDFSDMRRFGRVRAFAPDELADWDFYAGLGPEPLDNTPQSLAERFLGRKARIKALLLNQSVVAGVGNIYADESLHRAGLRPDRRAERISRAKLVELCAHLQDVLRQAIAENGSSIRDYRDAGGNAGAFQNNFKVYGRSGKPCPGCGTRLECLRVAGRTSTFCPKCQR